MNSASQQRRVTVIVLGTTGTGKSEYLNGYLQQQCFQACANPQSVTLVTSSNEQFIDGYLRTGIDTQSLQDTQNTDAPHVKQMTEFLKQGSHGVNAVVLIINSQQPRYDEGTENFVVKWTNLSWWDKIEV
jgi:predicted GTPase